MNRGIVGALITGNSFVTPESSAMIDRRISATVNDETFRILVHITPEIAAEPDVLARFDAMWTANHASELAEERWGPGELSGTFPTFTWKSARPN